MHNPQGEWTNQHLMSVNGKFLNITRADLLTLAERFAIGTGEKVLKKVGEAIATWPDFAQKANVSGLESDRIRSHHKIL